MPANRFADIEYKGYTLKHLPGKGWVIFQGFMPCEGPGNGPFSSNLGARSRVDEWEARK